jgi:hypothetical protein
MKAAVSSRKESVAHVQQQEFKQDINMKKIEVYDPSMCCSTGVCGTDIDPKLVQFASDLGWLQQRGVSVERFNLAQQPAAFVTNPLVGEALKTMGNECLPLVLVDGAIATRSIYPNREQLAVLVGLEDEFSECCGESDKENCCGGGEGKTSCCS